MDTSSTWIRSWSVYRRHAKPLYKNRSVNCWVSWYTDHNTTIASPHPLLSSGPRRVLSASLQPRSIPYPACSPPSARTTRLPAPGRRKIVLGLGILNLPLPRKCKDSILHLALAQKQAARHVLTSSLVSLQPPLSSPRHELRRLSPIPPIRDQVLSQSPAHARDPKVPSRLNVANP